MDSICYLLKILFDLLFCYSNSEQIKNKKKSTRAATSQMATHPLSAPTSACLTSRSQGMCCQPSLLISIDYMLAFFLLFPPAFPLLPQHVCFQNRTAAIKAQMELSIPVIPSTMLHEIDCIQSPGHHLPHFRPLNHSIITQFH